MYIVIPLAALQLRQQKPKQIIYLSGLPWIFFSNLTSAVWTTFYHLVATCHAVKAHEAKDVSTKQQAWVHKKLLADGTYEIFFV